MNTFKYMHVNFHFKKGLKATFWMKFLAGKSLYKIYIARIRTQMI
jgi:hypothetical protein